MMGRSKARLVAIASMFLLAPQAVAAASPFIEHTIVGPRLPIGGGDITRVGSATVLVTDVEQPADLEFCTFLPGSTPRLVLRRSTDRGATWTAGDVLSSPGASSVGLSALASAGARADLVWIEDGTLRYRRSSDAGLTWTAPSTLLSTVSSVRQIELLHAGSQVVVSRLVASTNRIALRISSDNGASFGPVVRGPQVAAGGLHAMSLAGTTLFLAYRDSTGRLRVRASLDGGATFPRNRPVAYVRSSGAFGLASSPSVAIVAYVARSDFTRLLIRRSLDHGLSWLPAHVVIDLPGTLENLAQVSISRDPRTGKWTIFAQTEAGSTLYETESVDGGVHWSARQRVMVDDDPSALYGGISSGGIPIVLIDHPRSLGCETYVETWRRP